MGVLGGLFSAKNDFKSNPFYVDTKPYEQNAALANGYSQQANQALSGSMGQAGQAAGLGLQGAQTGLGQSNAADAGQASLANQLALRAAGKAGPSIAEQQLSQSLGQVQQQGAGSLAAARGISPGAAARLISANQTNAAQQAAGQGAILRSQEQQAAENQLANVLSQRRQGALGQQQVGFGGFGTGQQGVQGGAATLGQNAFQQGSLALGVNQGNQRQQMAGDQINAGVANQNTANAQQMGMGILGGVGGALGLAHGGEVPGDESLASHLLRSHAHLSEAHGHLARYAAGGEVHGSYDFKPLDVSGKKPAPKPVYVPHGGPVDVSPTQPIQDREAKEGQDSEGNEKKLHLAKGGEVRAYDARVAEYDKDDKANAKAREDTRDRRSLEKQHGDGPYAYAKGGKVPSKPVYVPHEGPMDVSPTKPVQDNTPAEGVDSEGNKKVLKLAGGGLIGAGVHALGQLLGIGTPDSITAANTGSDGAQYQMDTQNYHPVYGQGSTFGPDGGDESDTRGANFAAGPAPVPQQMTPNHPLATPGQMSTPGFGIPMMDVGGQVPGQATHPGNNLKNDTVPAMLSPGEVVLPRTVSHDPEAAAEFVRHLNARKPAKMAAGGEVKGFGGVLAKQRELHDRMCAIEAKMGRK